MNLTCAMRTAAASSLDDATRMRTSALLEKKRGFTYEFFHGPVRSQGLAQTAAGSSEDRDMAGVVKDITYGDLWSKDLKGAKKHHGPPEWLATAYEGLMHFH